MREAQLTNHSVPKTSLWPTVMAEAAANIGFLGKEVQEGRTAPITQCSGIQASDPR